MFLSASLAAPAFGQTDDGETVTIPAVPANEADLQRVIRDGRSELFEAMRAAHPELADEAERASEELGDQAAPVAREAERQVRRSARRTRPPSTDPANPSPTEAAALPAEIARRVAEQIPNETVSARRLRHWQTLARRLGLDPESARPTAMPAEMRSELRRHAQRVARLGELRSVARGAGNDAMVTRIDQLVTREYSRHERSLGRINGTPLRSLTDLLGSAAETAQ